MRGDARGVALGEGRGARSVVRLESSRGRCFALLLAMLAAACAPGCTALTGSSGSDPADAQVPDDGGASGRDASPGSQRDGSQAGSGGSAGSVGSSGSGGAQPMDAGDATPLDAGDDASGDGQTANRDPVVTIRFPLSGRTDADTITVRGVASDPDDDAIGALTVNGVAVSPDGDGAFSLVHALVPGDNRIDVQARDARGANSDASVTVQRESITTWQRATDAVIDDARNRALMIDQNHDMVFAVDLATGRPKVIADPSVDLGPSFAAPSEIEIDPAGDRAFLLATGALFQIDLDTHERTAILLSLGSLYITDLVYANGLYAAGGNTFFEIQLPSGQPRVISADANAAQGPILQAATALTVDSDRQRAYLAHQDDGTIKSVAMGSGTRTLFTGGGVGSGPNISGPLAMAFDRANERLFVTDEYSHALYSVALADGARSVLADAAVGTGVPLSSSPGGFAFDVQRQRLLIADWQRPQFIVASRGALVWVDLTTKHRTRLSSGVGSGQGFGQPVDMIMDSERDRVLVADYHAAALIAVHVGTGNRFVLSDAIAGDGPALQGPVGLCADFARKRVFVADSERKAVFSVDVITGNRTLISGDGVGGGALFEGPVALVYDAANDRLWVADEGGNDKIVSVDLASGNRMVVSDSGRAGPSLDRVRAIVPSAEPDELLAAVGADLLSVDLVSGNRAYVNQADPALEMTRLGFSQTTGGAWYAISVPTADGAIEVVRVDLETGARTLVSRADHGTGPFLPSYGLRWQTALLDEVLLISMPERSGVLAVDTVSGDRVIFSM
jgi:DNA-binding beta-propeller fold protein YncE